MANTRQSIHGQWTNRWVFVLAATGAAVGLGNIWKFPYITGMNGGGAFVLVYLVSIVIIGIPLLMAEILIGRRGRQNPAHTTRDLSLECGRSKYWGLVGVLGVLSGFLILSYYSVIAGWAMDYILQSAAGNFARHHPEHVTRLFNDLMNDPWQLLSWHSLVILITTLIVGEGVQKGIEKSVTVMFPSMLILLFVLVGYAMQSGHFTEGLKFLFHPDFSKLSSDGILSALGHAFFTLSLATGSIMMYGAYLPNDASVTKGAVAIAIADTSVALLAGLAIFPLVFANGLEASGGPGLIFKTLPIAFSQMPFGNVFATLFFVMLEFAALTSAVSLLEPSVAFLMEHYHMKRRAAAVLSGLIIWILGFGTILSFNHWEHLKIFGLNYFEGLDYLTANIMLPLGGLLIALFAVWVLPKNVTQEELHANSSKLFKSWYFTMRYISPVAIIIVFLDFMGLF